MKKAIFLILFVLLWTVSSATAAPLKVGDKAPDFKLIDTLKKEWTLNSPEWKGKVIMFIAMPTDEFRTNAAISEAIYKDKGVDKVNKYAGAAIISRPSIVAKTSLRRAQRKMGKVMLMDEEDVVLKSWGLKAGVSNVIFLDKDRICRYIFNGKVPTDEVAKLMDIVKTYQNK